MEGARSHACAPLVVWAHSRRAQGVFEYAAKKADPPLNSDWVMAFAFKRAYRETRWRLGVWGWFSFDRTEDEQLGQVCALATPDAGYVSGARVTDDCGPVRGRLHGPGVSEDPRWPAGAQDP